MFGKSQFFLIALMIVATLAWATTADASRRLRGAASGAAIGAGVGALVDGGRGAGRGAATGAIVGSIVR